MKASDYLDDPYWKADKLEEGERLVLTVSKVIEQTFPSGDVALVLEFKEDEKRLVLNKTRLRKMSEMAGDETDDWVGKQISLYPIDVTMNGKQVGSVAIGPVPKKKAERVIQSSDDDDADPDVHFGDGKK